MRLLGLDRWDQQFLPYAVPYVIGIVIRERLVAIIGSASAYGGSTGETNTGLLASFSKERSTAFAAGETGNGSLRTDSFIGSIRSTTDFGFVSRSQSLGPVKVLPPLLLPPMPLP